MSVQRSRLFQYKETFSSFRLTFYNNSDSILTMNTTLTKDHLMNIASDELAIRAGRDLQGNVTFTDGIASMSLLIARATDSRYDDVYEDLQNLSLQKHKSL
jgi:hypothetical protein